MKYIYGEFNLLYTFFLCNNNFSLSFLCAKTLHILVTAFSCLTQGFTDDRHSVNTW